MEAFPTSGILVEAKAFDDFGGWVLDSQFELEMGSPYLLAHGNGRPVPMLQLLSLSRWPVRIMSGFARRTGFQVIIQGGLS